MINIKKFVDAAIASGAIKPTDPAATPAPSGGLLSGSFLKNLASKIEGSVKVPEPDTGSLYKRLTAADIEEENKKKMGMKKGGQVKSSASKRADGCAQRGKTRGKMV
jgi:hypothetical protein